MPSSSDKIVDEFPCVKGAQVIDALAKAHELHRHLQLLCDGNDDATLGGAVQLGEDDARQTRRLLELPGLNEAILIRY